MQVGSLNLLQALLPTGVARWQSNQAGRQAPNASVISFEEAAHMPALQL